MKYWLIPRKTGVNAEGQPALVPDAGGVDVREIHAYPDDRGTVVASDIEPRPEGWPFAWALNTADPFIRELLETHGEEL